jgi:hypothetical protein
MENKVYSDQFGTHDMSGWLGEKTEYVIEALLRLHKEIDDINNEPEIPYGYKEPQITKEEKVKKTIEYTLFDLTKIYSFALGGDWECNDNNFVLKNGLEKLKVKYGLIEETSEHHEVMHFVEKASNLIQGERYPNRTLFYDALLPMVGKDKLFDDLDNELELVRDGHKSWESFVIFAKDIIQQIKEKYQDS